MKKDNIEFDLELERVNTPNKDEFIPNQFNWLELEEQKIKAKELESFKYKKK